MAHSNFMIAEFLYSLCVWSANEIAAATADMFEGTRNTDAGA